MRYFKNFSKFSIWNIQNSWDCLVREKKWPNDNEVWYCFQTSQNNLYIIIKLIHLLFQSPQRRDRVNPLKKCSQSSQNIFFTTQWFVSKKLSSEEEPSLEECQLIKYQADLLFFRRDYGGALQKYEERLQYFTNLNNNSMLREVHGSIINCHLKLGSVENALHHVKEIVSRYENIFRRNPIPV